MAMARVASFVIIAGIAFIGSSLSGNVMVEKVRREGLRAAERAREARKSEAILRQQVDILSSLGSVDDWAAAHGFTPPGGFAKVANGTAGR